MKTKLLSVSFAMLLTTVFATANADLTIELVSGAVKSSDKQFQMCINHDDYVHLRANGYNGDDTSWTVNHQLAGEGLDYYFVPPTTGLYDVRLYDGDVINESIDNKGAELDDTVVVDVIVCQQ